MTEVINIVTNLVGADAVQRGLSGLMGGIGGLAKFGALGFAGLAAGAGIAFTKMASKSLELGDELLKLSHKTGVSVEALSGLKYAADLSDVSMGTLQNAFKGLNTAVAEAEKGSGRAAEAFEALNINFDSLKTLSPDKQLYVIAEQLAGVDSAATRTELAMALFGRAGIEMLPMLSDGAKGLQALADEAQATGNIMTTEAAIGADAFGDALQRAGGVINGAFQSALVELSPYLLKAVEMFEQYLPKAIEVAGLMVNGLMQYFSGLANFLSDVFGPAVSAIYDWLGKHVPTAIDFALKAFGFFRDALLKVGEYATLAFGKLFEVLGKLPDSLGGDMFRDFSKGLYDMSKKMEEAGKVTETTKAETKKFSLELQDVDKKVNTAKFDTKLYTGEVKSLAIIKEEAKDKTKDLKKEIVESTEKTKELKKETAELNAEELTLKDTTIELSGQVYNLSGKITETVKISDGAALSLDAFGGTGERAFGKISDAATITKDTVTLFGDQGGGALMTFEEKSDLALGGFKEQVDLGAGATEAWKGKWTSYEGESLRVFGTTKNALTGLVDDARLDFGDMFGDIFTRTETVGDAIENFFGGVKDRILRVLGDIVADKIWETLFTGASGTGGGIFGSLLGGAGGAGGAAGSAGATGATGSAGAAAGGGMAAAGLGAVGVAGLMAAYERWGKDGLNMISAGTRAIFDPGLEDGIRSAGSKLEDGARNVGRGIRNTVKKWFAHGTESVFSSPTLFVAGENGPETVSVRPTDQDQRKQKSGGHTYVFNGPVVFDPIALDKFQRGMMSGIMSQQRRFG